MTALCLAVVWERKQLHTSFDAAEAVSDKYFHALVAAL